MTRRRRALLASLAMELRRHASARDFLDAVGAVLRERPVINQLAIAIAGTCVIDPSRYGPDVRFYSAAEGAALEGVALQTPPWPVQVAECTPAAAAALGRTFAAHHAPISGVAGPEAMPEQFAAAYAAATGTSSRLETSLGTFELRAVVDLPIAAGERIVALRDHAPLIQTWLVEFHEEATPHDPPPPPDTGARAVSTGRAHLWLDGAGTPVSYAFNNRNVEGWASVGPVYTPAHERGRGYATSLVASLSRQLLDEGNAGCTLFTNLANPTSNAIYERIGYRRIGKVYRYAFG